MALRLSASGQAVNAPSPVPWLRIGQSYFTIELSVRPAAGKRGFLYARPNGPVVALNSPPEKGRANRELIEFIAGSLSVPAASIALIKGQGARRKVIRVTASPPAVLAAKLVDAVNRT